MFEKAFQPVAADLKAAQEIFRAAQRRDGLEAPESPATAGPGRKRLPVFEEISAEIAARPGKWMRPGLFLLAARAAAPDGLARGRLQIAAAVEMIQNASLLHDDVFDCAVLRRRRPTLNARWGNWAAVLYGDHLIATAFRVVAEANLPQAYPALAGILSSLCTGEFLQETLGRPPLRVTPEEALSVAARKTAFFVAEVCALGFACGDGEHPAAAKALRSYAMHLGLAYQIVDDVVDVVGAEDQEGKTLRTDLLLTRPTLAMAYLLEAAPEPARRLTPPPDAAAVAELTALMIQTGALSRALEEADSQLSRSRAALAQAASLAPDRLRGLEGSFDALLEALAEKRRSLVPAACARGGEVETAQEIAP